MSRRSPEVVEGYRSPANAPQRRGETPPVSALPFLDAGLPVTSEVREGGSSPVFRFEAVAAGYRTIVREIHEPRLDQDTGRVSTFTLHPVAFREGKFETRDPKMADALRHLRNYGRDFWDADEARAAADRAATEDILARVDRLPEDLKDKLRVRLGAQDFTLPPKGEAEKQGPDATIENA